MRKASYIASIVIGALMIVGGISKWFVVSTTLSDQKIVVSGDASCLAGDTVDGPFSAYCQAKVIEKHALDATGGKTYSELDQEEVAYYFSALAMGLLAGFQVDPLWLSPVLMAAILTALYVGDHPRLYTGTRRQMVNLDTAITDEPRLIARLEALLGAQVLCVKVKKVDLVNDTTSVDVRFRVALAGPGRQLTA